MMRYMNIFNIRLRSEKNVRKINKDFCRKMASADLGCIRRPGHIGTGLPGYDEFLCKAFCREKDHNHRNLAGSSGGKHSSSSGRDPGSWSEGEGERGDEPHAERAGGRRESRSTRRDWPKKIIMSGDHGREDYDEVNTMKSYAVERGVPSEDIFMDHAGFSTYESMYRAKEIFQTESVIVVTQKYHLYRAVYDAQAFSMKAAGVACDQAVYRGDRYRKLREMLARVKDFGYTILKPEPHSWGRDTGQRKWKSHK